MEKRLEGDVSGCCLDNLEPGCDGPMAPLATYIHVGDHVFDVRDVDKIYIPNRLIQLRERPFSVELKTDAEMQQLLAFMEAAGMHRAAATP